LVIHIYVQRACYKIWFFNQSEISIVYSQIFFFSDLLPRLKTVFKWVPIAVSISILHSVSHFSLAIVCHFGLKPRRQTGRMRFNHPIVGTNREDESEGWAVNCRDVLEVPRSRGFEAGKLESAGPRVRQSRSNLTEIHCPCIYVHILKYIWECWCKWNFDETMAHWRWEGPYGTLQFPTEELATDRTSNKIAFCSDTQK